MRNPTDGQIARCGAGTMPRSDCGGGRTIGATSSDRALAALSDIARIEPSAVFSGEWTGRWSSRFPLARLFYVFDSGPDIGFVADEDAQVALRPGTWALLPPGREIRHCQLPGLDVVSIHFKAVFRGGVDPLARCRLRGGFAPEWRDVFREVADAADGAIQPRLPAAMALRGAIWMALARVVAAEGDAFAERLRREEAFAPLFEAVAREPGRDFSVADMAVAMRMGEAAFAKRFAATMGESPRAWFNRRRAHAAAEVLLAGGRKVSAVADEFGFCDEFYFSRFFKRHFGLPPRAWLRQRRQCPDL